MVNRLWIVAFIASLGFLPAIGFAQIEEKKSDPQQEFLDSVSFRSIGPYRGGRSAATAGVASDPMLYYMGAAGGGVWKLSLIHI